LPALEWAVTVATSRSGWPASSRRVSPPAYPEAPTTAARGRRAAPLPGAVAGGVGTTGVEAIPEVYTPNCMFSHSYSWRLLVTRAGECVSADGAAGPGSSAAQGAGPLGGSVGACGGGCSAAGGTARGQPTWAGLPQSGSVQAETRSA